MHGPQPGEDMHRIARATHSMCHTTLRTHHTAEVFVQTRAQAPPASNHPAPLAQVPALPTTNRLCILPRMAQAKPSALVDTRVIYCGDNLDQLRKLPDACVDLITIDPPFNSNRNCEVFWGETKEKRSFEDRHESTRAYIATMRPQNAVASFDTRRFSRPRNSYR